MLPTPTPLLQFKQAGESVSHEEWNALVAAANRNVSGPNFIADFLGWHERPKAASPIAVGIVSAQFAKITSHSGASAPYIYSGTHVIHDGTTGFDPSNWTAVSEGAVGLTAKLICIGEIGDMGEGIGPLPDDSIVLFWPMDALGTRYACLPTFYRGTYP